MTTEIGTILRGWRAAAKLSRSQMGELVGKTRHAVRTYEEGASAPYRSDLMLWAQELGGMDLREAAALADRLLGELAESTKAQADRAGGVA